MKGHDPFYIHLSGIFGKTQKINVAKCSIAHIILTVLIVKLCLLVIYYQGVIASIIHYYYITNYNYALYFAL